MKTLRIQKQMLLLAIFFVSVFANIGCVAATDAVAEYWIGTWGSSAQSVEASLMPNEHRSLQDRTLRQIVRVSVGGSKIKVRISNEFGNQGDDLIIDEAYAAVFTDKNGVDMGTSKRLTLGGEESIVVPGGKLVVTDPVDFDLKPGSDVAITMHVSKAPRGVTGHRSARGEVVSIQSGNAANQKELPEGVKNKCWYYICNVEVLSDKPGASVVCLGDSITDGKGSTEGLNRRWPDYLARRLQANEKTANIGVLNQGIGGNNIVFGGLGEPVSRRFDRDVLAQPSVKWIIILEGINDIGGRGRTTAEQIINTLTQAIDKAKAKGIKVYASPILPCGDSFYYNPTMEAKRQQINEWIKTTDKIDAVIDWDAVVRDPEKPANLLPKYDSGDHLHISDAGYEAMAEAVDLGLFKLE